MATRFDPAARRLARLRFGLHDGPQQEIHLLAEDLRRFRANLGDALASHPDHDRALAALDDLAAQIVAIDRDLRRLVTLADSPLAAVPLGEALVGITEAFTARSGIVPEMTLGGELRSLTDSQQIALLSLVREALTNVRQHSSAEHVSIELQAGKDAVWLAIADDGCGFSPEPMADRLGLIGMRERVAMLDGQVMITSAPGSGTSIRVTLPRWVHGDPPD